MNTATFRLLARLAREGATPAIKFPYGSLEEALAEGYIDDVPWEEKPTKDALRWIRLTGVGRAALKKEG